MTLACEYPIGADWTLASLNDGKSEHRIKILEGKKKRQNVHEQIGRSFEEPGRLLHDFIYERKPYSRAKNIPISNKTHSSNGQKEKTVSQWNNKVTRTSNNTLCAAGNLPALDILGENDDLSVIGKTIRINNRSFLLTDYDHTGNFKSKTRDFQKIDSIKNPKFTDEAIGKAEKELTVDDEICQSIRKQQLAGNHLEETSWNQIEHISDPFIGGHHLSSDDSLDLSNLCEDLVSLHDFSNVDNVVGTELGHQSFEDLDVIHLPNKEIETDSGDQISLDSLKQVGDVKEEKTDSITLENTLIYLGIDPEPKDLFEIHKSDENSDLEDSKDLSSEEEPTDSTDCFQAHLAKLMVESMSTKSITPFVKKELQYKIQYQRLERGDEELKLEPGSPIHYKVM